ncbi:hypothetical protein AVDCRST_MAG84-7027 [uncultured Microcoleus sp.]|uniref:Uncharacterized protein n=1 Tax=uncultured Microcoleus sp. TaxID=259945 RepID=A0A6J4PKU9_9CYAN|nr:hypothetical protein AVDCRST_MAG84-7027 [uncultured Microcoleus sp.]
MSVVRQYSPKNQVSEYPRVDFQLLERCKNSPDRYTIN